MENEISTELIKNEMSWNLSAAIVQEIQYCLSQSTITYNDGKLIDAFFWLYSAKLRFVQSLDIKEQKSLEKIEYHWRLVCKKIKSYSIFFTKPSVKFSPKYKDEVLKKKHMTIYNKIKKIKNSSIHSKDGIEKVCVTYSINKRVVYADYNRRIMTLLNSYGYLIPTKKSSTGI